MTFTTTSPKRSNTHSICTICAIPYTTRVTINIDGEAPDGTSFINQVAGAGQYVVFESQAKDLVDGIPADAYSHYRIFVWDATEPPAPDAGTDSGADGARRL